MFYEKHSPLSTVLEPSVKFKETLEDEQLRNNSLITQEQQKKLKRLCSITAMKEYSGHSFEELRWLKYEQEIDDSHFKLR